MAPGIRVMIGYACDETPQLMPMPVVLANRIVRELSACRRSSYIEGICPDGKAQVTVEYEDGKPVRLDSVVVSCQHTKDKNLKKLEAEIRKKVLLPALRLLPPDEDTKIFINPSGRFVCGGIIRMSRKILFLQAQEINWNADVWFLERFHFSKERMNPSKPVELASFKKVTDLENQKILQKYLRYLFGITDLSISTIRIKLLELRTFLVCFNRGGKPIYELEAEKIQKYLEGIRDQNTREATSNGRVFMILQFYNFLVVKGYLKKLPFRHEYYLQKEVHVHNDRSVPESVYVEILSKLAEFPEHLRLMFLHLWCTGIRGSEVCTLTGGDYEEKNGDYWLKVYQVKMKTYKRIPIPEALYKLVQVYKKKYQIEPEEYLFQNQKGGAFRYGTFQYQMLKYCEKNQIANGEYIFKSHDYRHNLATLYYDSGISLQAVRDYLGHEYEGMTRQYVDYMPKKLEKASEAYFQEETHSFGAELMKGEFHG